jgi:hypothetical protein
MSTAIRPDSKSEALRERYVQNMRDRESSPGASSGEDTPQVEEELDKEKKTFGRTPNGTSKNSSACCVVGGWYPVVLLRGVNYVRWHS